MKKFISLFIVLFCSAMAFSQLGSDAPWMKELQLQKKDGSITLKDIKLAGDAYWQTHDKNKKGSGYKPYMRWLNQMEAFVKPDGTLQSSKEIMDQLNAISVAKSTMMDESNWVPAGPFNYTNTGSWSAGQGRVNTIKVDPNNPSTYYIGAPNGGIWKSTDAGINWTPLSDFIGRIGVSAIEIDPNNSNIIYIGTGDDDAGDSPSIGMLKSTDGGLTFNPTGLVFAGNSRNISEIYVDPNDSNKLFISANNGFYRSTNGGQTVVRTFQGNVKDIKLNHADSNIIYLATDESFYRSTDNGVTFTSVTAGLPLPNNVGRIVIGVTPANSNYVYLLYAQGDMSFGGIYRSTNGGSSFTRRDNGSTDILESSQAWFDLALEVSETDPNSIYTGCLNVWKSTTGGSSFFKINDWNNPTGAAYTHADIHQIRQFGNELFVCSDGGIYKSTDTAVTFTDLTGSAQISQFYRIAVSPTNSADMIGGLQDNGGFTRTNNAWSNYYGADGMDTGINPQNPNIRYGFTQNGGGLYFTTNGISNAGSIGGPEGGNWITPLKTASDGTIYAGYSRLYTVDPSSGFTPVSSSFGSNIDVIEIDPSNNNRIYVGVNTRLFRSDDAGSTFNLVYTDSSNIQAIEVSNTDSNVVYITTNGINGRVLKSTNLGASFTNITANLPFLGKNTLAHQPLSANDALYVGCTVGIYRLTNSSNQWEPFMNNLPNSNIRDLEINAVDNTLTAATYGRGIWQTAVTVVQAQDDASIQNAALLSGSTISCSSDDVDVTVRNNGQNIISTLDINYTINNGAVVSQTLNTNIPAGSSSTFTLSGIPFTVGDNELNIQIVAPNDQFPGNNNYNLNIIRNQSSVGNDIYSFASRDFLTENADGSSPLWERGVPAGSVLNNAGAGNDSNVYATNLDGDHGNNTIAYLYSGCYDLTSMRNPVVQFDMAFSIELNWDLLYMQYSVDGGISWSVLGTASDPNWYNSNRSPNGQNCFNCVGAQWTGFSTTLSTYSYNLAALSNENSIIFRFVYHSDQFETEEGAVIDNFVVTGTLSNENNTLENSFTIYPNPSKGAFNLRWNNEQSFDYSIYDLSGKLIQSQINNTGTDHKIDLNNVSQGLYLIKIATKDSVTTQKLLIE
ncbi:T9SS type A sorting domain-containing protein [Nonlabens tegetincola]|uniref:T9SS type A sorting domain-containing protein n=1 Tax=Nonlabens tegetincola TaxID=323273 RepID=UPI000CF3AF79|nr:T9SS type A sorting domain-containing protein [Nonlabens tegetincola]PQJ20345.1 glycosyl hydrolase [Nonlabens tegetincola]